MAPLNGGLFTLYACGLSRVFSSFKLYSFTSPSSTSSEIADFHTLCLDSTIILRPDADRYLIGSSDILLIASHFKPSHDGNDPH